MPCWWMIVNLNKKWCRNVQVCVVDSWGICTINLQCDSICRNTVYATTIWMLAYTRFRVRNGRVVYETLSYLFGKKSRSRANAVLIEVIIWDTLDNG